MPLFRGCSTILPPAATFGFHCCSFSWGSAVAGVDVGVATVVDDAVAGLGFAACLAMLFEGNADGGLRGGGGGGAEVVPGVRGAKGPGINFDFLCSVVVVDDEVFLVAIARVYVYVGKACPFWAAVPLTMTLTFPRPRITEAARIPVYLVLPLLL